MADYSTDSAFGFILVILFLALFGCAAGGVLPRGPHGATGSSSSSTGGTTHLIGQAAITINHPPPGVPAGANVAPAEMDMVFDAARTSVAVANFVPIVSQPFQTSLGMNTTTVSLQSGGNGPYNAGSMAISLVLFFDQSIDLPFIDIEEDSTLPLRLTTDPPGSVVDAAGNVVLAGTGTFQGGFLNPLNGMTADVTLTGKITPPP
jgi:hypothetical protein